MNDVISRQAAIDIERRATVDTNPEHFESHQKFVEFMDDAEISSFGRWQWSNGFNTALTAVGIDLKRLPSAQPEITDEQAIEHLQSTGWMQNHDREMYDMGFKKQLADDSGSYDSLLPSAQSERKTGRWSLLEGHMIPIYKCSQCNNVSLGGNFCPNCGSYNGGDNNG